MIKFEGRNFKKDIILQAVRWYIAYALSCRDVKELMEERGVCVDHVTIHRWVVHFGPKLETEFQKRKINYGDRLRMDEAYIKVGGKWKYLYRAVDKDGNTIDFLLTAKRDTRAAKRFFEKLMKRQGSPSMVNIDKSGSNNVALELINTEENIAIEIRQNKYMNNVVDQDHRQIRKLFRATLGFKNFHCAQKTLVGFELMHMIKKGQMQQPEGFRLTAAEQFYTLAG
ncbi:IS6 family transposase [Pseudomaricurvus alkylphenolicus]|uniref:IS6 family transposase n=1 Tax=Pseudomaricurvus alkylphenolicus TaxID=1306991 RepID=UPI00141E2C2D|nr:IS6 family transposase [Pseudomaricurvus alkylphenolicus]NIB45169.1 IS6 family transposase [Pseudomaricurvus alkylphenolicus]